MTVKKLLQAPSSSKRWWVGFVVTAVAQSFLLSAGVFGLGAGVCTGVLL
jgi:hypothetical protein